MHRDEVVLGAEAVDLDQVVRAARPECDQEGEIVVRVEFRPLAELRGILERKGVKMEGVPEQVELWAILAFCPEVEPKRLGSCEQFPRPLFGWLHFFAVQRHQVAVHGAILAHGLCACRPACQSRR